MNPARFLGWDACINTRELGGYPVAGGSIRWKTLVRSDNSALLSKSGQRSLIDYGIRTVIDLRFPFECSMAPSPFSKKMTDDPDDEDSDLRPDYINIPMDQDQDLLWPSPERPEQLMSSLYRRMLELNRKYVANVLTAIARARPGGVLVHCHAGKDRTGLIIAVLLGSLGASKETVLKDYAYSNALMNQKRTNLLADSSLTSDHRAYLAILTSSLPGSMLLTINYLERAYGSIERFLQTTPLQSADFSALRDRLVETGSGNKGQS